MSGTTSQNSITSKISETVKGAVNGGKEAATWTIPLIIDNTPKISSKTFPVYNPATDELLHHCSAATIDDAEAAIISAHKAFASWRRVRPQKKRDIFLKAAAIMESRKEELVKYMMEETGSHAGFAGFNIMLAPEILKDVAGRICTIEGSIPMLSADGLSGLVYKEPYGVILGIAPWNAPYILGVRSVVYAMAAGNTAILKAPEMSPACSHAIVSCLHDAGLPKGVLNLIAHTTQDAPAITKFMIEHDYVKKINFTGSTVVGKIIAETAGRALKPVLLELGGKAPAIVWEDADLKLAAKECALGSFMHSGQVCMSTEKILVHEKIASAFEEEFKLAVKQFFPADEAAPVLVTKVGVEKNKRLLKDAVDKGAILVHGHYDDAEEKATKMRPVVVKGTKPGMDLYHQESFGPTVSIIEIKSEEEALEIANYTEYGLNAAVFTENLVTGLRFAKNIEAGAVHINGMTIHDETALPHGGTKSSGYGRFGATGLDEWVRTKTVTYKD